MNSADATLRARVCVHACAYLFVCVCVRVYVRLNVKAHARCIYQPLGLRWGVCVCVHACLFVHVCVCVCAGSRERWLLAAEQLSVTEAAPLPITILHQPWIPAGQ